MKFNNTFMLLSLFIFTLSCSANNGVNTDAKTVKQLMDDYFPTYKSGSNHRKLEYKLGDFNGDGIIDVLVLFQPGFRPAETVQLKISKPWRYPGSESVKKHSKSIAIFNGSRSGWKSDKIRVYVLLDNIGVLETPSFKLLLSKTADKNYAEHNEILPVKSKSDLIIIPTEAGIDTYIYWDKNEYKLFEPDEIP